jgi:DNA-binding response OmpR family regulator
MDTNSDQPSTLSGGSDSSNTVQNKQPVILLVEDDPVLSRMYSEKFRNEGFSVLTAYDGEAGYIKAIEEDVDMVLLDIMLPKLSGTDLLAKLRQTAKGQTLPVIALTNLAEKEEQEKAISLGVKEYLVKAMQTPEKVVETVKKYL